MQEEIDKFNDVLRELSQSIANVEPAVGMAGGKCLIARERIASHSLLTEDEVGDVLNGTNAALATLQQLATLVSQMGDAIREANDALRELQIERLQATLQ